MFISLLFSAVYSNDQNIIHTEQRNEIEQLLKESEQLLKIVQYMIYRFVQAYYLKEVLKAQYIINCIIHDETSIYEEKLSKIKSDKNINYAQLKSQIISLKQELNDKINWINDAVKAHHDDKLDQYAPGLTYRVKLYYEHLKDASMFKHFAHQTVWTDWQTEESFGEPIFKPPKLCIWMFLGIHYRNIDDEEIGTLLSDKWDRLCNYKVYLTNWYENIYDMINDYMNKMPDKIQSILNNKEHITKLEQIMLQNTTI